MSSLFPTPTSSISFVIGTQHTDCFKVLNVEKFCSTSHAVKNLKRRPTFSLGRSSFFLTWKCGCEEYLTFCGHASFVDRLHACETYAELGDGCEDEGREGTHARMSLLAFFVFFVDPLVIFVFLMLGSDSGVHADGRYGLEMPTSSSAVGCPSLWRSLERP